MGFSTHELVNLWPQATPKEGGYNFPGISIQGSSCSAILRERCSCELLPVSSQHLRDGCPLTWICAGHRQELSISHKLPEVQGVFSIL